MNKIKLFVTALCVLSSFLLKAQRIDYTTSWLGNTYGGTTWVQDMISYIQVDPDGTVYAYTGWDEGSGGPRRGTYKDGNILPNHSRNINFKQAIDKSGKTWTIYRNEDVSVCSNDNRITCSDGRIITDVVRPMALAIANNGMLMVGEYGPRQQVLYYDISGTGTPTLHHTFGDEFGTNSGIPGIVAPLKFREITGVGEDANGNIYVAQNNFVSGCKLGSYTPAGILNWEINGLMFVDNGDFDPTTDGIDVYTKSHHFVMDYSKPVGKQWTDKAYTINRFKYPDDARLHNMGQNTSVTLHPSSCWVRYKEGEKFMFVNDMYNSQLRGYRFNAETDGEIAIPSVLLAKENVKPYLFNLNLIKFDNVEIQTLTHCEKRGTEDEESTIGYIQGNHYLAYCNVDFGSGKTTFTASCGTPTNGGILEVHADSLGGRIIGSVTATKTGGWSQYKLFSAALTDTITGSHKIYVLLKDLIPMWPVTLSTEGQWFWTDTNGDGQMDDGEYQSSGSNLSANGFWVDKKLDIWIYGGPDGIIKMACEGIDVKGNLIYNRSAAITTPAPSSFSVIKRLEYDSDNDIMYLINETQATKYSNWETNKSTPDWVINIPGSQSMSIAGDYLFTCEGFSAFIYIYNLADGKYTGTIKPGPEVANFSGWIDIPYGIRAMKRSNGEYVVLAEEDGRGKILVYRFSSVLANVPPTVRVTQPTNNQQFTMADIIAISTMSADVDGMYTNVKIFVDGAMVSDLKNYKWSNPTSGTHLIYARAYDSYGDSTTSETVQVNILITGINAAQTQNTVTMYPNPASERLYVNIANSSNSAAQISILDLNGKTLMFKNTVFINDGVSEIDVSGFSSGIYILRVENGTEVQNLKLVINK